MRGPRSSALPLAALSLCAAGLCAAALAAHASGSVGADLRVVNTQGRSLAQLRQFTDTARIRADPNADCFGFGSGGSGSTTTLQGPSALGLVNDAQATQRALRPVEVTDAFGFGLGVCGFGGFRAEDTRFWYLKVDHVESAVGGDQVQLKGGEDVVWYLINTAACPAPDYFCLVSDLVLKAPARARANSLVSVTVSAFSRTGVESPAVGATVAGGEAPAVVGADGRAAVQVGDDGTVRLFAYRGADIPSQSAALCVSARLVGCPARRGRTIAGSDNGDLIGGTPGPDKVRSRGGDDSVNVRGGDRDKVGCGAGTDKVRADRRDRVGRSCERVRR
jgi:hypothetical protein